MDPIVQGLAGGLAAVSLESNAKPKKICFWTGVLAGLAPDLDVLIRSSKDPLLEIEYHRHFTHSLVFIPVGALIVALFCNFLLFRKKNTNSEPLKFSQFYKWAFWGYATHGPIDACTSYGTQLLWPFSNTRIAWNNVAIVDPIVTIILALGAILLFRSQNRPRFWAGLGCSVTVFYLLFGIVQRDRAVKQTLTLAQTRGHTPERLVVKPTILNNVLFRSIYEHQGVYFVDAIRVGWFGGGKTYDGVQVKKLVIETDLPWLNPSSKQYVDLKRFTWFSDGFVFKNPEKPEWIGDLRFALLPNERDSLWWLVLNPTGGHKEPAQFKHFRSMSDEKPAILRAQIFGN